MSRRLKRPPGRASNVGDSVQCAWSGGKNHLATACGSIHKPKTLSRGAAKLRSTRSEIFAGFSCVALGTDIGTIAKNETTPASTYFLKRLIPDSLGPR